MVHLRWFSFQFVLMANVLTYNLDTEYPIVYQQFNENGGGNYFGMSVAIRPKAATLNNTWVIQIGAPRGNVDDLNVKEPGVVYRCYIYGPCRPFLLEKKAVEFGGQGIYTYKDKKDGAWIGVSMDIKLFNTFERSLVCGHRWINQNLKNSEHIDVTYLMTGACYLQDLLGDTFQTPVQKLLPLVNADKIYTPKPYVVDLSTYHWGLGQAGASAILTEDPANIVLGAPGVTHWIGSVIRYGQHFNLSVGNFAKTEIPKKNRYTYVGYSVAAGKFYKDKKLWYVAGAPRSAHYRGELFIFQYKGSTDGIYIQSNLVGTTFGEYFGASLATSDVNGDGLDDLVVGAPLYSSKDPDEGRIYVYLGNPRGEVLLQSQVLNGGISQGRFGSSVAALQDLDGDGYNDVAVGSPHEHQGKGAIYIFRGFSSGLRTEFSQRICAQDLYPHLRGFGISISSAVDVDGNRFGDLAVGSYLSDHVVLLRSRPVISLHPKIKTEGLTLIDRKASYLNISVCMRFTGPRAPDQASVFRIVDVDPLHGRGSLPRSSSYKKITSLQSNEFACELLTISLKNPNKNYSPLEIILKNELPSCGGAASKPLIVGSEKLEESDGFFKWCPIGEGAEAFKEIPFAGVCGVDNVCRSDLELSCDVSEFRSGIYVLGSSDFSLAVQVKNLGEPAYAAKLKIWSDAKLRVNDRKQDGGESESSKNTFWFDLDGTFVDNYQSNFSFKIDLEELQVSEMKLSMIVEVSTSSTEINLNNNRCNLSVKLVSETSIELYSSSSVTNFLISKEASHQELNVTHYYEVQKIGATPVKDAVLTIYIPFFFTTELVSAEIETAEWMHFSINYEKHAHTDVDDLESDAKSVRVSSREDSPRTNRTLFLNCSNEEVQCHVIKIFFDHGIPTGLSSYVKILLSLNTTAINSIKGDNDIIHLSTCGRLRYWKMLEDSPRNLKGSASVSLFGEKKAKAVEAYVVALSVLAGGVLLSFIVTALVKGNFFKRTKKQELKALKEAEASFIYFDSGADS